MLEEDAVGWDGERYVGTLSLLTPSKPPLDESGH